MLNYLIVRELLELLTLPGQKVKHKKLIFVKGMRKKRTHYNKAFKKCYSFLYRWTGY